MLSIQTNMLAWNAGRQNKINGKKNAKSMERLSSGYKINRAADDASGLSISEKMRRQIRGLKQGSDNIQEGISLIQVADGAMGEVVDILQRINELSVKAYNGTNTEEDRGYIQEEVTHLIKEIERIADTTTFNEKKVLKGNPKIHVKIEADKTYMGYLEDVIEREVPEWLKAGIDDKLAHHSYSGLTQDGNGKMFKATAYDTNGHITGGIYYGPVNEGTLFGVYTYGGTWTNTLDDNRTAKISFGELAKCDDATTLYTNMLNLLGCAVGVPCGTCDDAYYGIGFSGEEEGFAAYPGHYMNSAGEKIEIGAKLDISKWKEFTSGTGEKINCFDKIKELIQEQEQNTSLSSSAKQAQTLALADEIAQKLCAKTYKMVTGVTDYERHFDRALTDGKYDIIVYDYRDSSKLDANASDVDVNVAAIGNVKIPYSYLVPGTEVEMDNPLWIVCSSQFFDEIPIDLPLLTTEALGITGYDVGRYNVIESYSDSYQAKLEAWQNDFHYETVTVPAHTIMVDESKLISATPVFNDNGEFLYMDQQWEKKSTQVTVPASSYQKRVQNHVRPIPEEGDVIRTVVYEPDDNRKIKDALSYVSKCRTTLGAEQNRLEHAYNNNLNKHENTTASESVIRDTDIANEIVAFSNNNILLQAGVSLLSQANQSTEIILSLLQ